MLNIKSESSKRRIFARKGEAVSTAAFEAGFVPIRHAFGRDGSSDDASSTAGLSSLIQRRGALALAATMGRKAEPLQPIERKLHEVEGRLMPLEADEAPAAPARAPMVLPSVSPAPPRRKSAEQPKATKPKAGKRHQFTVRLRDPDFRLFTEMAVRSHRTYQDIIEKAVRSYVRGNASKREEAPTQPDGSKTVGLFSRLWS